MAIRSNRTGEAGSRRQFDLTPRSFVNGNYEALNEHAKANGTKCLFSNDLEYVDALSLEAMKAAHPWTSQFEGKVNELRRSTSFVLFTEIEGDRDALFFEVQNGGRPVTETQFADPETVEAAAPNAA